MIRDWPYMVNTCMLYCTNAQKAVATHKYSTVSLVLWFSHRLLCTQRPDTIDWLDLFVFRQKASHGLHILSHHSHHFSTFKRLWFYLPMANSPHLQVSSGLQKTSSMDISFDRRYNEHCTTANRNLVPCYSKAYIYGSVTNTHIWGLSLWEEWREDFE